VFDFLKKPLPDRFEIRTKWLRILTCLYAGIHAVIIFIFCREYAPLFWLEGNILRVPLFLLFVFLIAFVTYMFIYLLISLLEKIFLWLIKMHD
jgi:hypothetical protein